MMMPVANNAICILKNNWKGSYVVFLSQNHHIILIITVIIRTTKEIRRKLLEVMGISIARITMIVPWMCFTLKYVKVYILLCTALCISLIPQ